MVLLQAQRAYLWGRLPLDGLTLTISEAPGARRVGGALSRLLETHWFGSMNMMAWLKTHFVSEVGPPAGMSGEAHRHRSHFYQASSLDSKILWKWGKTNRNTRRTFQSAAFSPLKENGGLTDSLSHRGLEGWQQRTKRTQDMNEGHKMTTTSQKLLRHDEKHKTLLKAREKRDSDRNCSLVSKK